MFDRLRSRLASAIAPVRVDRVQRIPLAVQLAGGSFVATQNPRTRPRVPDGTGDFHLDEITRRDLRNLSRDLERSCDYYDALLGTHGDVCVGTGPVPQPRSRSSAFREAATARWKAIAHTPALDRQGLRTWGGLVKLWARSVARDGDGLVYHIGDGRTYFYESDQVAAVETDGWGAHVGYRVVGQGWLAGLLGRGELLSAQTSTFMGWLPRSTQRRGQPVCTAGLDDWKLLNDLFEIETVGAANAGIPWVVIQHAADAGHAYNLGKVGTGRTPGTGAAGTAAGPAAAAAPTGWVRTDSGAMMGLPPGLQATPWSPDRPNINVPIYVEGRLRYLSSPLLPYEIAFGNIGALNYAAIRALRRLVGERLAPWRTQILAPACSRVWADWARTEMLAGRLPMVDDYAAIEWDWPELPIQDREKDAAADTAQLANGTTSLPDLVGPDWRAVVDRQIEVAVYRAQRMREASTQAGADLTPFLLGATVAPKSATAPAPVVGAAP